MPIPARRHPCVEAVGGHHAISTSASPGERHLRQGRPGDIPGRRGGRRHDDVRGWRSSDPACTAYRRGRRSADPAHGQARCRLGVFALETMMRFAFDSIYSHGFVRLAVGTPAVRVADPQYNLEHTIELATRASAAHAAIVVFPELGLSAYSNEDLFHQEALLEG